MGLSVISPPPRTPAATSGASAAIPPDSTSGSFAALLSGELSNSFSLITDIPSGKPIKNILETDPKSPLIDPSTNVTPQIDPSLIASLNAANQTQVTGTNSSENTSSEAETGGQLSIIQNRVSLPGSPLGNTKDVGQKPTPEFNLTLASTTDSTPKNIETQSGELLSTPPPASDTPLLNTSIDHDIKSGIAASIDSDSARTALNSAVSDNRPAQATNIIAPATQTEIRTHLRENVWSQHFNDKVVWLAKNDIQSAQININPPELGPMEITLNLNGDQAKILFTSPHAEVRQVIESALPQLKEMLSSAGISLGQASVGANLTQQNRDAPYQNANGKRLTDENAILPVNDIALATGSSAILQHGRGLVDLFA